MHFQIIKDQKAICLALIQLIEILQTFILL